MAVATVRRYIESTHGGFNPSPTTKLADLLADDFVFSNETETHDKATLLSQVFPKWSSIVDGNTTCTVHSISRSVLRFISCSVRDNETQILPSVFL